MSKLEVIRESFAKTLVFFIWFAVLVVIGAAWFSSAAASAVIAGLGLLSGTLITAVWLKWDAGTPSRAMSVIALASLAALFVVATSDAGQGTVPAAGGSLLFPAFLVVLAGWFDRNVLAGYAVVVVTGHLVLALVHPAVLPVSSALLQAGVLCVALAALWRLTLHAEAAIAEGEATHAALEQAQVTVTELRLAHDRFDEEAAARRQDGDRLAAFGSAVLPLLKAVEACGQQVHDASLELSRVSADVTGQAATASDQSGLAASNVQTVASAAEELASSISEIARQVTKTREIVASATEGAQASNARVSSLAAAASRIGEVVSLIQAIAEQTNLLALNATIEAARAGVAGRGFAVVAAEVKELANQTSRATEEISTQVTAIQSETKGTVEAIGAIAAVMQDVNSYTTAIAAAVEEQGAASGEISRNVAEAAQGTELVAGNIGGISTSAGKTMGAAASLSKSADALREETARMRAAIDGFLSDVA